MLRNQLRKSLNPLRKLLPETVAQSNAPTSANPEKSESENLQKTKADTVHINQLLKGTLDRPLPKE